MPVTTVWQPSKNLEILIECWIGATLKHSDLNHYWSVIKIRINVLKDFILNEWYKTYKPKQLQWIRGSFTKKGGGSSNPQQVTRFVWCKYVNKVQSAFKISLYD